MLVESHRVPRYERVIVIYKCGCSFYNDSWVSSCESEPSCLEHGQAIIGDKGEWVHGIRPDTGETKHHPFKIKLNLGGLK